MRALPFFPQCFSQNSDSCTCPATSSLMDFWLLPGTLPDHFSTPCKSSGPFLLSSERRTHYFVQKRFCVSSNVLRCQVSPASRAESSIYFPGVGNKTPRRRSMCLLNWKALLYIIVLSLPWTKYSALAPVTVCGLDLASISPTCFT